MRSPAGLSLPRYGEAALADLTPSLLAALGVAGERDVLGIEPLAGVCLLVVDGLGWELLHGSTQHAPFLADLAARGRTLTAGFPATTAASLGSLGTGLPPGEHGILGYTMAVPGDPAQMMNNLSWETYGHKHHHDLREAVPPESVQPLPTAFERAVEVGITVTLVGPPAFARSGLTRAALRGGRYRRVFSLGDLVTEAAAALRESSRRFVYTYYGGLDAVGHRHGPSSEAWALELAHVDLLARMLAARLPSGAALVITADHGMVDLGPEQRPDIDTRPDLLAGVRLMAGEARARYLYTVPGAAADVLAAWEAAFGEQMWLFSRQEAIDTGLFGPRVPERVQERIGDVVAIARGPLGIVQRSADPGQADLAGHHGSVTATEQMVPLLLVRG
jgi:hypothetical protein